jgi:hypothetical protein
MLAFELESVFGTCFSVVIIVYLPTLIGGLSDPDAFTFSAIHY